MHASGLLQLSRAARVTSRCRRGPPLAAAVGRLVDRSFYSGTWPPWAKPPTEPQRQILRLRASAQLRSEADASADALGELTAGDLVEAPGEFDLESPPEGGWLLVRSPLEERIDVMSDKPLEYQDGWLEVGRPVAAGDTDAVDDVAGQPNSEPLLERAELQLGDRVAAQVLVSTHPALDALKKLPPWKDGVPQWMKLAVAEIYTGKVAGVVKRGRFLIQRPGGAMPERVASQADLLVSPRDRGRHQVLAGLLGLSASLALGASLHLYAWGSGASLDHGLMAWPLLVGWVTLIVVFLTPVIVGPCYAFANSKAATACVVAWMNMLLYLDLFSE